MLAAVTFWSYRAMLAKRELADRAVSTTERCAVLAAEMPALSDAAREKGYVHAEALWLPQKLMEDAGERASLPPKKVQTTRDQATRRVADTVYLEQDLTVQLGDLTMPEVIRFLLEVDSADSKFVIKRLELDKSDQRGQEDASERWTPRNLTLSYYIISRNSTPSK
jgi:hypothetical protein